MKPENIEWVGWRNSDISALAQDRVADSLRKLGANIEILDVSSMQTAYRAWRHLDEYAGEYATYNGALEHCLLEKTLEHYISLVLINPKNGMTGMDVGSCKSVFPAMVRRIYGVNFYEQDLEFPPGLKGNRIGSSADQIPLQDQSVDFITLHCTFEHFEGEIDKSFVTECARLLKNGGVCVILPLYMNESHCNITGETDSVRQNGIGWDGEAEHFCVIPEWKNRFGRHYSPSAFMRRVYNPAVNAGLNARRMKIENWDKIHSEVWLRWVLVLEK